MNNLVEEIVEKNGDWYDDTESESESSLVTEYDISISPNDFNIRTLYDFIESGAIVIPDFQRHFVWDRPRASKLIESLILGLPVPQIFLYEKKRNKFVVIDGQQRLLSIYYFIKEGFPRQEKRSEIREIFEKQGNIPNELATNADYFQKFRLSLTNLDSDTPNRLAGLTYSELEDYKTQFDMRTIRNIVIKQNSPENHNSMYEIFTRLNTGGMKLSQQEIRASMYDSKFYQMLHRINQLSAWRGIIHKEKPDLRLKDVEILLRGFAILVDGSNYKPSMVKFLNKFSRTSSQIEINEVSYLENLFNSFLNACSELPPNAFINKSNSRFNIALFEAVFTTACKICYATRSISNGALDAVQIKKLENDEAFKRASQWDTTGISNVKMRLAKAQEFVEPLKPTPN